MVEVLQRINIAAKNHATFIFSTPNLNFLITSLSDLEFRESHYWRVISVRLMAHLLSGSRDFWAYQSEGGSLVPIFSLNSSRGLGLLNR